MKIASCRSAPCWPAALPMAKKGWIRALAQTTAKRSSAAGRAD